jgi:hypothetical protein
MRVRIKVLFLILAWTTVNVAAAGKAEKLVVVKSTKRIVDAERWNVGTSQVQLS